MGQTSTQGHITIKRQRNGKDGEDSVRRYLVISPTALITDSGNTTFEGANTIHCEVWAQEGGKNPSQIGLSEASVEIYKDSETTPLATRKGVSFDYTGASPSAKSYTFKLMYAGTCVDTVTVPVLSRGYDSIIVDLDNESDVMLYDDRGNRVGDALLCNARLYEGSNLITLSGDTTITAVASGCTISSGENKGTHFALYVSAVSANNATVTFTATYKGKKYTAVWTIKKMVGVDKYEIVTTPTAVKYDPNSGEYSSSITVDVYRTTVEGVRTKLTDNDAAFSLAFSVNRGTSWTVMKPTGTIAASAFKDAAQVDLKVYKGNVIMDYETVPIVAAGVNGTSPYTIDLDNESDVIPCDSEGKTVTSVTITTHARLYKGSSLITSGVARLDDSYFKLNGITPSTSFTNGVYTLTWSIPSGTVFSLSRYTVNVQMQYQSINYTAAFTAGVQKSGKPGVSPSVYQLLLSQTDASFARNSSNVLTPAYIDITCGYTKTYEGKVETYPGTDVRNTWYGGGVGAPYNILFRGINADGTYSSWGWIKDVQVGGVYGVLRIQRDITFVGYEFILTSAGSIADITDSKIIDRETLPINKDGLNGADGEDGRDGEDGKDGADGLSIHTNLLRQTIFADGHMDMWDPISNGEVAQGLMHRKSYKFTPDLEASYQNTLQQNIYNPSGEQVVELGKWYTLSFYAKSKQYYELVKDMTSPNYGFATQNIYLQSGSSVTIRVYGSCSQAALNAGRYLRVYLYSLQSNGSNWKESWFVDIKSTYLSYGTINVPNIPETGMYYITAYVYPSATAVEAQNARIYSYDINRGMNIRTHVYPDFIDTTAGCYVDGVFTSSVAGDGARDYKLTESFVRHSYTFKTKASISGSQIRRVLLRMTPTSNETWICMPKLEEGIHATDYVANDLDIADDASDQLGFPNFTGVYNEDTVYKWDDVSRDFMEYPFDGVYYRFGVKKKGMTVPAGTAPTSAAAKDDPYWTVGVRYACLIANTIFGDNANIGGFLASASVLKSQNGSMELDGRFGTQKIQHKDSSGNVEYEWSVDEDGVQTMGTPDGQRIELNPSQRSMKIYNQDGEQSAVFEGNSYNSIESLFGNSAGSFTPTSLLSKGSFSEATSTTGSFTKSNTEVFRLTTAKYMNIPIKVSVAAGTLYASGGGGQNVSQSFGVTLLARTSVILSLCVSTYSDSSLTKLTNRVVIKNIQLSLDAGMSGSTKTVLANDSVIVNSVGYHVVEIVCMWLVYGKLGSFVAYWGQSPISGSVNISTPSYVSNFYVSRYFANGFCLGMSRDNYFWLHRDSQNKMVFEGVVDGNGFKSDKDGVMMKHHSGNWQKIPQLIMWGEITLSSSGISATLNSFDGSKVGSTGSDIKVARDSNNTAGRIVITFPSSWPTLLGMSTSNTFVTLTGKTSSNILVKGTIDTFDSSKLQIMLSDDSSPNDGIVYIKVEKMS